MKYTTVLIDIDDTLFDFQASSYQALQKTFSQLGIEFGPEQMRQYSAINNALWDQFERGEIPKAQIFSERFRRYLALVGIDADSDAVNRQYMQYLSEGRNFMPHCEALLKALQGKYLVCVVTNGSAYAQERRISCSGYMHYFDEIFISEKLGCKKPEKEFFDQVFAKIGEDRRKSAIIVGDSLNSDMQGGRNASIATCLYKSKSQPDDRCDYAIDDLLDLIPILEGA